MKYRVVAALAVVVYFAVFFQNCGMNVRFANVDGQLLAKSVQNEDGENVGQGDIETEPLTEVQDIAMPTMTPAATEQNEAPVETPVLTASQTPVVDASATPLSGDGGPLNFVCVLNGPGRSVLLGYIDQALSESKDTPDTVCTTKRGCEEIISSKFDVKEAVERGYCNSNKHVIKADEVTLRQLIGD